MKKLLVFVLLFVFIFSVYQLFHGQTKNQKQSKNTKTSIPTETVKSLSSFSSQSIFVPYWAVDEQALSSDYDTAIYFGITANEQGIDQKEDGYMNIPHFFHMVQPGMKTLLTIRLLSSDVNQKFVNDSAFQQTLIDESMQTAKTFGFTGIVVDFEYNALAFPSVVDSITLAMQHFETKAHTARLLYYQAFYGDNFYRLRPYDTSAIAKNTDGVFLLAYDLHKANGDAGPNFPIVSNSDYTFPQMLHDFTQQINPKKITVVFGMFGYDWTIGTQGKTTNTAIARSFSDIQNHFINSCSFSSCVIASGTAGTKITYTKGTEKHIIWIDPEDIVTKKKQLLLENGIGRISYWAYGYF